MNDHRQFDGQTHAGRQTDGEKQSKGNNVVSFVLDRVEFHYQNPRKTREHNKHHKIKLLSLFLYASDSNLLSVVLLRYSTDKLCGVCATSNDMKSSSYD